MKCNCCRLWLRYDQIVLSGRKIRLREFSGTKLEMKFIIRDSKDVVTLVWITNWPILSFFTAHGICRNEYCHVAARTNLYYSDSIRYVKLGWVVTLVWRWLISSFVCIHPSNATEIITRRYAKGQSCRNFVEEHSNFNGWAPRLECLTHTYSEAIKYRFSAPAS